MEISLTAVIAQIINFWIVFFLFKRFLAKPIVKMIEERRELIKKLENADKAYAEKISSAEKEAKVILQEGLSKKDSLVMEAGLMATKKKEEILKDAEQKAVKIVSDAKQDTQALQNHLEENFEKGVKKTSLLVLQKLLKKDTSIQSEYLDSIVKEVAAK